MIKFLKKNKFNNLVMIPEILVRKVMVQIEMGCKSMIEMPRKEYEEMI